MVLRMLQNVRYELSCTAHAATSSTVASAAMGGLTACVSSAASSTAPGSSWALLATSRLVTVKQLSSTSTSTATRSTLSGGDCAGMRGCSGSVASVASKL
jgi:hypothetical protein